MAITAQDVNKLRQMTGAGMMDCKKALVEADGDFEKAIELLRKKGQKVSANRADRETTEGIVVTRTNEDKTKGVVLALTCETDFVAKNEDFVALANLAADLAFENAPADVEALLALSVGSITLGDKIIEATGKIGEKIDEDMGLIFEVFECETCKGIVEAGGIIPFRSGLGQCNSDGVAIERFPQLVLDAEIAYQNQYPLENDKGEPVPTAWGIVANSDHNGKKMLKNPDINIRIS